MKKIVILLMIFGSGILLSSCKKDTIYTYYFQNRSGYDIVLEAYISEDEIDYIEIPNEEDYITTYISYADPHQGMTEPFYDSYKVHVIFNNERELIWERSTIPGEGIYYGEYRQEKTGEHSYDMFFTFTPEMYEEAIPLDELEDPEI